MVMLNVRHTVADYAKWRPFFDEDDARRRKAGQQGTPQVYRDVDNPNVVTIMLPWDNAENALRFAQDPAMAEVMQKAGVVGMPAVRAILSPA
ncbi:MAG TPA: hypothetical protein VMJ64_08985 [Anaerolineales bacterium]|nr:hypothetical protein [Anaerolineales bacterium]